MSRRLKIGLGIVVAYTSYSTYVQLWTKYQISERSKTQNDDHNIESQSAWHWPTNQFGSLIVGGRFANPFSQYRTQTVYEFLFCRIAELFKASPRGGVPAEPNIVKKLLPSRVPDFELLYETSKDYAATKEKPKYLSQNDLPDVKNRLTLTWIGQSCAFVQMAGLNILTDPCFGDHLLSKYVGPKRISPAPCSLDELPRVDVVLVSHDHPDHLELETAELIGNSALWIVPLGVKRHLDNKGINNVIEMDWWDRTRLPIVNQAAEEWEVVCTPAMHWSGRNMIDSNSTLWCSFMVTRRNKPVFFHAGDTGYSSELFKGISKVIGAGCKVAMIPCGSYVPRWHLRPQHTDPSEALQVMKDLGARKMVGVHWGTFVLSDEHFLEPRDKLHELAKKGRIEHDVIAPEFGRTLVFNIEDNGPERPSRRVSLRDGYSLLLD